MRSSPLWLLVLALLLTGCDPALLSSLTPVNPPPPPTCEELAQQEESSDNPPFETIPYEPSVQSAQLWPETIPTLLLLTSLDDAAVIEPYIQEETAEALQEVDFDTSVVVAAFSGTKGHGAWQFCITSVTEEQGVVRLHAHLVDAPVAPDMLASYYHIVSLSREVLPSGEVSFALALTHHDYVNPTGRQRDIPSPMS